MKFEQYKMIKDHVLAMCGEELTVKEPTQLNPIVLAYIGDTVFSFYVRMRLLPTSGQVRVLHDLGARMVSAVMQAKAMDALEEGLSPEEAQVAKRGRNTKSHVPKSATVREYRQGTALEALVGWLFLMDRLPRLEEIMDEAFAVIHQAMLEGGAKKK